MFPPRKFTKCMCILSRTLSIAPEKELKAYGKVTLGAHEKKEIEVELDSSAFAYWSTATDGWKVDDGVYEIMIGASSRDIRLSFKVEIKAGKLTVL